MTQEKINQILADYPNVWEYVDKVRAYMKSYFFLLLLSVALNVALFLLWSNAIGIAKQCIASL